MDDIIQSVIDSLDGQDDELFPFLPYLVQDLWEIGASPTDMLALIEKHYLHRIPGLRILDLGCGKGAVSVQLAKEFESHMHGIDAMPEFIEEAKCRAKQFEIEHLCDFEVNDIRRRVNTLSDYDIAILGSIGPVFGDVDATLSSVIPCVKPGGYIILDDGYLPDNSELQNKVYPKRSDVLRQLKRHPIEIVDEYFFDDSFIEDSDLEIFSKIQRRTCELMEQYPAQKPLFDGYLEAQKQENDMLENHVVCVMWLLKTLK